MQDASAEQAAAARKDEINAARKFVTEQGIEHVKVGVFDMDGILRGKYLARDKFLSVLEKGLGFLRRGFRVGLERSAVRQCEVHRLAYGISGRHGARAARDSARYPLRAENRTVLAEFTGSAEAVCRAARCGACSGAQPTWATASALLLNSNSSCSPKRPSQCARRAIGT